MSLSTMDEQLIQAIKDADLNKVQHLLEHGLANVNAQDRVGCTPLHHACGVHGKQEIIQCLVDHYADVNLKNTAGSTPLHACIQQGHMEVAFYLINQGADPMVTNHAGKAPLDIATCKTTKKLLVHVLAHRSELGGTNAPANNTTRIRLQQQQDQFQAELNTFVQQHKEQMTMLRNEIKADVSRVVHQLASHDTNKTGLATNMGTNCNSQVRTIQQELHIASRMFLDFVKLTTPRLSQAQPQVPHVATKVSHLDANGNVAPLLQDEGKEVSNDTTNNNRKRNVSMVQSLIDLLQSDQHATTTTHLLRTNKKFKGSAECERPLPAAPSLPQRC